MSSIDSDGKVPRTERVDETCEASLAVEETSSQISGRGRGNIRNKQLRHAVRDAAVALQALLEAAQRSPSAGSSSQAESSDSESDVQLRALSEGAHMLAEPAFSALGQSGTRRLSGKREKPRVSFAESPKKHDSDSDALVVREESEPEPPTAREALRKKGYKTSAARRRRQLLGVTCRRGRTRRRSMPDYEETSTAPSTGIRSHSLGDEPRTARGSPQSMAMSPSLSDKPATVMSLENFLNEDIPRFPFASPPFASGSHSAASLDSTTTPPRATGFLRGPFASSWNGFASMSLTSSALDNGRQFRLVQ